MSISSGSSILIIGNSFLDRSALVDDSFIKSLNLKEGTTNVTSNLKDVEASWNNQSESWTVGGSGTNVAKTLAQLGNACYLCGKIGEDDIGNEIEKRLNQIGITCLSKRGKSETGVVNCFVNAKSKDKTMHAYFGASSEFCEQDIEEQKDLFKKVKHAEISSINIHDEVALESIFHNSIISISPKTSLNAPPVDG